MACIFKRGKQGIWWIKYYAHGRQVYHSLKTKDARMAKRIKQQIEGEKAKEELAILQNVTLVTGVLRNEPCLTKQPL